MSIDYSPPEPEVYTGPVFDLNAGAKPSDIPAGRLAPIDGIVTNQGIVDIYQVIQEDGSPVARVIGQPRPSEGDRGFLGGLLSSVSDVLTQVPILPMAVNMVAPGVGSALTAANAIATGNIPAALAGIASLPSVTGGITNALVEAGVPQSLAPAVNQAVASGVKTALSGGDLGDVLSSAAVGGAGSAILGEVGKTIKEALPEGIDPALSNIIAKTAVSTLMGKDPLSAVVGAATNEAMKNRPGLYTEPVMADEFGVREQAPGRVDDFVGPPLPPGYTAPAFDEFMGTLFPPADTAPTGDPLKDLLTQLGEYKAPADDISRLIDHIVQAPSAPPSDVVGPPAPTQLQRPTVQEVTLPGAVTGPLAPVTMESPTAGMSGIEQLLREEEKSAPTGMVPIIEDKPATVIAPPTPQSQVADSFRRLNDALGYEQYDDAYIDMLVNSGMSDEELTNLSDSLNNTVDEIAASKQPAVDTVTLPADEFDITDVFPDTGVSDAEKLIREGETGVIDTTGMSDAERLIREGETGVIDTTGMSDAERLIREGETGVRESTGMSDAERLIREGETGAVDTTGMSDIEKLLREEEQMPTPSLEELYQESAGQELAQAQQKFLDSGEVLEELVKPTTPPIKPTTPKPVVRPPVDYQKVIDNAVQNLGSQLASQQQQQQQQSNLLGLLSMLGMMGAQTPAQEQPPAYQYADIGEITPFEEMFTPYSGTMPKPVQRRV